MNGDINLGKLALYETHLKTLGHSELLKELIRVAKKAVSCSPSDISNHQIAICSGEILNRINGINLRAK